MICFGLHGHVTAQNLYDDAHTAKYAEHLFETKQYGEAAREYKKLPVVDDFTILRQILISYRLAGLPDSGINCIKIYWGQNLYQSQMLQEEFIKNLISAGRYKDLGEFLKSPNQLDSSSLYRYGFYNEVLSDSWPKARGIYHDHVSIISDNAASWDKLLKKQAHITYKSPALAATLSIVPGVGKIYADDWKDGAISMLLIGSLAYESYVGFHARGTSSVLGYVFGGLTVGYYFGNIYGSYKAAVRYNRRKNLEIHDEAQKLVVSGF